MSDSVSYSYESKIADATGKLGSILFGDDRHRHGFIIEFDSDINILKTCTEDQYPDFATIATILDKYLMLNVYPDLGKIIISWSNTNKIEIEQLLQINLVDEDFKKINTDTIIDFPTSHSVKFG